MTRQSKHISSFSILISVILVFLECTSQQPNDTPPPHTRTLSSPSSESSSLDDEAIHQKALSLYHSMSDRARIAQTIMSEIEVDRTHPETLSSTSQRMIRDDAPGGVILFARNIKDTIQTTQLIHSMQSQSALPLFISIDMEGGNVNRFKNTDNPILAHIPSSKIQSRHFSPLETYATSMRIGAELKQIGINMNFAPVVDVLYTHTPSFLASRIYGTSPEESTQYALASMNGLQDAGIMSVIKHFPGHGGASGDTHFGSAVVPQEKHTLMEKDLLPYNTIIDRGVAGVMLGHMYVPALDKDHIASASPSTIAILKDDFNFKGLVITDSLKMGAVRAYSKSNTHFEIDALNAGVDILLDCPDVPKTIALLETALENGTLSQERLKQAVIKILVYKLYYIGDFDATNS